jgi:enoyl-CoA hydratase/carnithine racemase
VDEPAPGVRVLALNRPERRNALGQQLALDLRSAFLAADADPEVRAIVLTAVDPAFCAGIDLKEAAAAGAGYGDRHHVRDCIDTPGRLRTPVVGAMNGATFTGGLELALGCDFLVASERAYFADTHARVGILPGGGLTVRLPLAVGPAMARRMSLTGDPIDAPTALRCGLVTEVVPHADLVPRAVQIGAAIAEVAPEVSLAMKGMYVAGAELTVAPALAEEQRARSAHTTDWAGLDQRRAAVRRRNRGNLGLEG